MHFKTKIAKVLSSFCVSVLFATAAAQTPGKTLNSITFNGLSLFKTSGNKWALADSARNKPFVFLSEIKQDENEIHLWSEEANSSIYIDVNQKTISLPFEEDSIKKRKVLSLSNWSEKTIVNGWTVNKVTTSNGSFYLTEEKKWIETDLTGKVVSFFTETNRDNWSVYLLKDDGHQLQIDLFTKAAISTPKGEKPFELYKFTGWENEVVINGHTIKSLKMGKEWLLNISANEWVNTDSTGKIYKRFTEIIRNDTSVYFLKPDSTLIQVDMKEKKVLFLPSYSKKELVSYPITEWSNELPENGLTINQVSSGKILFFYQPGGNWVHDGNTWVFNKSKWIETDSAKKPFSFFTEKSRDLNSILLEKDDGLMLRISLADKMIYLKTESDKEQGQYPISGVKKDYFVNGWTVNKVTFQNGTFTKKDGMKWVETDTSGKATAHFTETNRDEFSVYLLKDDGNELRIDLYLKSTFFTTKGEKPFELYKLTGWFNH